ncbi:MAG: hypothetical protein SGPRY_012683 [Prymnesium sp.]
MGLSLSTNGIVGLWKLRIIRGAKKFPKLSLFVDRLDELGYGDATRIKLRSMLDSSEKLKLLKLQLAAMMDMQSLISTTYELEGDHLELLLVYDCVERLHALGESLRAGAIGSLPTVDVVLRADVELKNGTCIKEERPAFSVNSDGTRLDCCVAHS